MKKILIAAAVFSAFAAQAQVTGHSTNTGVVYAGASTVNAGPHTAGNPGVGVDAEGNIINLGGITRFTGDGSQLVAGVTFNKYKLDGYQHIDPADGNVSTNFNWFRIPSVASAGVAREVYFGLATEPASGAQAAFYVGDRTSYALPTSNTNYATVAYLSEAGGTHVLTGNLRYDTAGTLNSATTAGVSAALTGTTTTSTLGIDTTVNASTGSFSGNSRYNSTAVTGNATGEFYGAGTTSAVAGTATGTGYVAAFGGIRN